jgi:hypothetical protein
MCYKTGQIMRYLQSWVEPLTPGQVLINFHIASIGYSP